ncbi:hypothetical protein [Vulcanisaeta distributa]|uniref:Uncharacterized protein n=1 Tax=Vulcanisaeta distributa (strain DSM 14429 / JCM 11212 / NBRC 100878 / IC-017) TaxID=572478 RepID=E1QSN8_VULDI|nr:hypothetical protein [Vulcanisaeta distributa]ADN49555.1 hypothetical protein Vdis_0142 [Vulcanisaeta distributa DSM 14429]
MSAWLNELISGIVGFVGGIVGYVVSTRLKPEFKLVGITGNELDINFYGQNVTVIQCGARLEVRYHWRIGERFVTRNATGWVGVLRDNNIELHGASAAWALPNDPVSTNIVGRESLILFRLVPAWGPLGNIKPNSVCQNINQFVNKQYILVFPPGNVMCARYHINQPQLFSQCASDVDENNTIKFRAAAENANGIECNARLGDVIRACLESYCRNKVPMKNNVKCL